MTDPVWRASKDRRLVGIVMFAVAAVVWLLFVTLQALIAGRRSCEVDGPRYPRAFPVGVGPVRSDFSMWPIGLECEWPIWGPGTVVAQADWGATIIMVCIGAVSVWGLMIALVPLRPRYGSGRS
jgi:hypothetical protein